MKNIKLTSLGILLGSSIIFSSCGNKGKEQAMAGQADQILPYPVKVVSTQTAVLENDYPATIKGQEDIEIRPRVDGFIKTINVDEGSLVRQGQVLFTLDSPQYAQDVKNAQAAIKTASAQVKNAEMNVKKLTPLVDKGIISKYQLEAAQYTLQTQQGALGQARANLANAQTNLSYTVVRSPVNGIVGSIPLRQGSLVNSTSSLTTVANTGSVYVYFSLNEKQLLDFIKDTPGATQADKIRHSEPVSLVLSDKSVYDEKGRIETISGIVNTQTGAANFRAKFANNRGLLRSGSTGSIRIPKTVKNAIVISQKSTYELQGKTFVYLVQSDNTVKQVAIEVSPLPDGQSFVVNSGLKENDKIVSDGIQNLKDGAKIKPQM